MLTTDYTRAERVADAIVHGIGVPAGLMAVVSLGWVAAEKGRIEVYLACAIYGAGLLGMLGLSAAYNLARDGAVKEILRRLDHGAIYLMIAGSYTPFALVKLPQPWGTIMFCVAWGIAAIGMTVDMTCWRRCERLSVVLYLVQGWLILVAIKPLIESVSTSTIVLLVSGGLLYTVGVGFHLARTLRFHNAIWHGFVLIAASCHFAAIFREMMLLVRPAS